MEKTLQARHVLLNEIEKRVLGCQILNAPRLYHGNQGLCVSWKEFERAVQVFEERAELVDQLFEAQLGIQNK